MKGNQARQRTSFTFVDSPPLDWESLTIENLSELTWMVVFPENVNSQPTWMLKMLIVSHFLSKVVGTQR